MDKLESMLLEASKEKHIPSRILVEKTKAKVMTVEKRVETSLLYVTILSILASLALTICLLLAPISLSIKLFITIVIYGLSILLQLAIVINKEKIKIYLNCLYN